MHSCSLRILPYPRKRCPNDTIAGHTQLSFDSFAKAAIDAGRLRAIATTGANRDPRFPEIPTVAEYFPGYRVALWQGFMAPAGVAREIIMKLNAAANAALREPGVQAKFKEMGLTVGQKDKLWVPPPSVEENPNPHMVCRREYRRVVSDRAIQAAHRNHWSACAVPLGVEQHA